MLQRSLKGDSSLSTLLERSCEVRPPNRASKLTELDFRNHHITLAAAGAQGWPVCYCASYNGTRLCCLLHTNNDKPLSNAPSV